MQICDTERFDQLEQLASTQRIRRLEVDYAQLVYKGALYRSCHGSKSHSAHWAGYWLVNLAGKLVNINGLEFLFSPSPTHRYI